jgi:predicted amidohydrolase
MKHQFAVVQMCSGLNPEHNLQKIEKLLAPLNKGYDAFVLPECFFSYRSGVEQKPELMSSDNAYGKMFQSWVKKMGVDCLGGTAAFLESDVVYNRMVNMNAQGQWLEHYDKIHLFSCNLRNEKDGRAINEGDFYHAGSKPKVLNWNGWKIGLTICFDMRFPELYRYYYQQKVDLLFISAAFTVPTGKAHWETLLRARAIENQCYVIASAQWGEHYPGVKTYGHSLVVSPWGEIIADLGEGECAKIVELDSSKILDVKNKINVDPRFVT